MAKMAMIEITVQMANQLSELDDGVEIYELNNDGTESLIETLEHFNATERFGIEGVLFGEPYGI